MKRTPFNTIEYYESYTSQGKGLNIIETEDTVIVRVCESFPTQGYYISNGSY